MGGAGGTASGGETRKGSLTVKWGEISAASDEDGTAHGVGGFGGDLEAAAAVISHPQKQVDAEDAAGISASEQQQLGSSQPLVSEGSGRSRPDTAVVGDEDEADGSLEGMPLSTMLSHLSSR